MGPDPAHGVRPAHARGPRPDQPPGARLARRQHAAGARLGHLRVLADDARAAADLRGHRARRPHRGEAGRLLENRNRVQEAARPGGIRGSRMALDDFYTASLSPKTWKWGTWGGTKPNAAPYPPPPLPGQMPSQALQNWISTAYTWQLEQQLEKELAAAAAMAAAPPEPKYDCVVKCPVCWKYLTIGAATLTELIAVPKHLSPDY